MGVILTIIKLLWGIVPFCSDGKVFKDYHGPTTIDNDNYWFTTGLTSFEKAAVTNCKYVVIRGFLKEKCLVDGKVYFKCPFSENFYRLEVERCNDQKFTNICKVDPFFYQSCGHFACPSSFQGLGSSAGVCGDVVCQHDPRRDSKLDISFLRQKSFVNLFRSESYGIFRCDGSNDCSNNINGIAIDEYNCEEKNIHFLCQPHGSTYQSINRVHVNKTCDKTCDCTNCFDEANCFNLSVGYNCLTFKSNNMLEYIQPRFVCNNQKDCISGKDEQNCNTDEVCYSHSFHLILKNNTRSLNSRNKCSVPDDTFAQYLVCKDYRDQMNCSNSNMSLLECDVDGYPTTLSEYAICKNLKLCDDAVDDECFMADTNCKVHKHRMCDGFIDCPNRGADESTFFCQNLAGKTCVRRISRTKSGIHFPTKWILDGVRDCVNGLDENREVWFKKCGTGDRNEFVYGKDTFCDNATLLKCPVSENHMAMNSVCQDFSNCDFSLCLVSRQSYRAKSFMQLSHNTSQRKLFFCLSGLESLQRLIGMCESFSLKTGTFIVGIEDAYDILSNRNYAASIFCENVFGELYIYLICTGQCKSTLKCPLVDLTKTSCINYPYEERALTITAAGKLTVILFNSDGARHQNVFSCRNDNCIEFHKVCDLVDDCGDASDEGYCHNNFRCHSGEYIPLSRKCNGKFDCLDFSDECNGQCDNQVKIFSHFTLRVAAWTVGTISIILNVCILYKMMRDFRKLSTGVARTNSSLMVVISFGDLLQGVFLLLVAIADKYLNNSNCVTQFKWTTSRLCNILGMVSTTGSQISLFSMTILSLIRGRGCRMMIRPSDVMSRKSKILLAGNIVTLFAFAVFIAAVPLFSIANEYFVRSLVYENNLFVGNLDKSQHEEIIRAYYGRVLRIQPTWKIIKQLVQDMFINGKVMGEEIGFYGSNGFCLFNYFVRTENNQKWFTGSVLLINLICVVIIAICYIIVNVSTQNSLSLAGATNKAVVNRNKKIQRKVAVLITTDVISWIPFIIVTVLHFTEVVDASSWYSVFSIIVIPCNSTINPILIMEDKFSYVGRKILGALMNLRRLFKIYPMGSREDETVMKQMKNQQNPN